MREMSSQKKAGKSLFAKKMQKFTPGDAGKKPTAGQSTEIPNERLAS